MAINISPTLFLVLESEMEHPLLIDLRIEERSCGTENLVDLVRGAMPLVKDDKRMALIMLNKAAALHQLAEEIERDVRATLDN